MYLLKINGFEDERLLYVLGVFLNINDQLLFLFQKSLLNKLIVPFLQCL